MTDPKPLDGALLTTDPREHAKLKSLWDEMASAPRFTLYVRSIGFNPPDDRPGWDVVYEISPDGKDVGLVWAEPEDGGDE